MIDNFTNEYGFLSNFYESKIVYEGIEYPTVEHAFQAAKTFDKKEREYIASLKTPSLAKRAGRRVELRRDWEEIKEDVMLECLRLKFAIPELRKKLLATNDTWLMEGNTWHDNYWGNCTCDKCKSIVGKNRLGHLLSVLRKAIRDSENKKVSDKKRVLIIVDMQNDFIYGVLGTKEAQAIVLNVKNKIKEYIDRNDMVIFTRDTHFANYLETNEGKHLPVAHCIKGTWGWEIEKDLDVPEALHIDKPTFGWTSWSANDIDTAEIEIVGLCTDICVVSNALILKATFPDANITVDASCCAGVTPETHNAALTTMESCQIKVIR